MLYSDFIPEDSPSIKTRRYHIANLLPFWESKTLADVKGSTCRDYTTRRTNGKLSSGFSRNSVTASTARHELKTLQAAINHWHRESPLKAVPKVTLPKPGERRERVLERSEVARMLWACRQLSRKEYVMGNMGIMRRDYSYVARFILIGVYTGTRHDAILGLQWDSSPHRGHIDFQRGVMFRRGSNEKETSKRRPPVKIVPRLFGHLERWRRMDGTCVRVIHANAQPVLKMKRAWKSVVKAAGLGPDVTPHVLRHTCVSWNLWAGKTIWEVAGIVGADASTIDRIYGHHRKVD
jgi:integrase